MSIYSDAVHGTLSIPSTADLHLDAAHRICQALLGVRFEPEPSLWRIARRLAIHVQWWARADRYVFVLGDWQSRDRLEVPVEAFDDGSLEGLRSLATPHALTAAHLAVALCVAWETAGLRAELEPARWRRMLGGLRQEYCRVAELEDRPRGWIHARLHRHPVDETDMRAPVGGRLSFELVPTSKRTGKPLKGRSAPKSLAAVERKVRLEPGDRRICRLAEQRRLLGHIQTYKYAGSTTVDDEVARLDVELLRALADVTEVSFEGAPVTAAQAPWRPRLRVLDDEDGGLELRWVERPLALFTAGAGFVIDASHRLAPMAEDVPPVALRLLMAPEGLPRVPASEVAAFLDEFVLASGIPVDLSARSLGVARSAPTPRLLLSERGSGLAVEVRFGYRDTEVAAETAGTVTRSADGQIIQRDRAFEAQALTELEALLPAPPPTVLEGDAAFDFLLDGLAALGDWSIFLDEAVRRRRPRGTITPGAQLRSGVDWFDLEVAFTVGGEAVKPATVLEAWAAGRRYVALGDGRVARLPGEWLRRHGAATAELIEVRKAGGGRLGAFAAPLAAGLLREVPASPEVQRWRDLAEALRGFDRVPERDPPPGITATLRDYQHRGYRWLCALRQLGLGGVLADDMGLGKTLQTLTFLAEVHREAGPATLVVAPTSVVHNWVEEAARFTPTLRVALHHGSNRGAPPTDVDVVVTSYALLRVDQAALVARPWRVVVLDEAQAIKNPQAKVAQAARALNAQTRFALTGTPIENHLLELWSLFQFLLPGFFGSRAAFGRRYGNPIQKQQDAEALAQLRRRIRPFILRRLKDEVARELPPRQEQILYCTLGKAQRALYERVRDTYRATVLAAVDQKGVGGATIQVLEALTRLRQACCDPRLLPMTEAAGVQASAKLDRLMETVDALVEEGHRALIFSQWPSLLSIVRERLDAGAIEYLYLDGSTKARGGLQRRWNRDDGPPLFLISLKAGGTGLNLTGADHVIHLDPWWNPAVEQQATDRAHRIGQTRPVMVYKLVVRDSVEEKILEMQARKRALAEAAVDAERMVVDALTRADLEAVFSPAAVDTAEDATDDEAVDDLGLPPAVSDRLVADGRLTTGAVAEALELSRAQAARQLGEWVEAGLLVKRGRGRGVHYRTPEAAG